MDTNHYEVYELEFPDHTFYVGMTRVGLKRRAGKDGKRYMRHPFYSKIVNFGWDNITKRIVKNGLNKQDARDLEKEMIEKHKLAGNSLNVKPGGETGDFADSYELNGKFYTSGELLELSDVEGLTAQHIASRIHIYNWSVERAITQPLNVKVQPHGVGEKKYFYEGKYYNTYELVQMSSVEGLKPVDITTRVNKHGWTVEEAITKPKKKRNQKFLYNGNYYTTTELAKLSPIPNLTCHHITDRFKQGWSVEDAVNTPIKKY